MVTKRSLSPVVLLTLAFLASGCGPGRIKVYPTEGQVLIDGKPAANVFVLFSPVDGKEGAARPSATTDLEGKFRLTTFEAYDGAPAGEYVVTVLYEPVNSPLMRPKGKPPVVPPAFSKPESSPLRVKVAEKGPNQLDPFKLS